MPDELAALRRRHIDDAYDRLVEQHAAQVTRRCKLDPIFRKMYGRYIRREVDAGVFGRALEDSLDREKREAEQRARWS